MKNKRLRAVLSNIITCLLILGNVLVPNSAYAADKNVNQNETVCTADNDVNQDEVEYAAEDNIIQNDITNNVEIESDTDSVEMESDITVDTSLDYVEGEVIYLADTEEDAIAAAEKFGGTVKYYSYGVATILLPKNLSTEQAFDLSQDNVEEMPEVWPNYIDSVEEMGLEPYQKESAGTYYQWFHSYLGTEYAYLNNVKGQGVKVAVVDTGVRESHLDISGNTLPGRDFYNGAKGTPFSGDPKGHGTHVAGIIGARGDNDFLGSGIAPEAKIASFRVASPTGTIKQDDAIRAINAIIADGTYKIINISVGGYGYNGAYRKVCQDAYENGIAICASAGNDGLKSAHFPSSYPHVISSGAVDKTGATVYFSNYGEEVDLYMPGYNISSLNNANDMTYRVTSGTSMASPMASGVAALILSSKEELLNDHTSRSVDMLEQIMKASVPKSNGSEVKNHESIIKNALGMGSSITNPNIVIDSVDGIAADLDGYSLKAKSANNIEISSDNQQRSEQLFDIKRANDILIKGREAKVNVSVRSLADVSIYYTINGKNPDVRTKALMEKSGTMKLDINTAEKLYEGSINNSAVISGNMILHCNDAKKVVLKVMAVNDVSGEKSAVAVRNFLFEPPLGSIYIKEKNGLDTVRPGGKLQLSAITSFEKDSSALNVGDNSQRDKLYSAGARFLTTIVKNGTWSSDSNYVRISSKGVASINKNAPIGEYSVSFTGNNGKKATYNIYVVNNVSQCKISAVNKKVSIYLKNPLDEIIEHNILDDIKVTDINGNIVSAGNNNEIGLNTSKAEECSKCDLRFVSSNERIVRISENGVLIPVEKGTAKIKVTTNNGSPKTAIIKVTVNQLVTGISINGPVTISQGKTVRLDVKVMPSDASNKKVMLKCIEPDGGIKVTGNRIKAAKNASGTYTIAAVPKDGGAGLTEPATYTVVVKEGSITSITDSDENRNITLFVNNYNYSKKQFDKNYSSSYTLKPVITPIDTKYEKVRFLSENERVATVNKFGQISANSVGKTTVTVEAADGSSKKLTYSVNVIVPMSSLRVTTSEYSSYQSRDVAYLSKGGVIKLKAAYESAYGEPTDKRVVWKSDNDNIVVNNRGEVTAAKDAKEGEQGLITVSGYLDPSVKASIMVKIIGKNDNGGIIMTNITSQGATNKAYIAVEDKNITKIDQLTPMDMCSYEAEGNGVVLLSKHRDDKTGITGYIPYAGERTTSYTYDEWMSMYETVKNNKNKKKLFYKHTGILMKMVAKKQDGSNSSYYKEFYVFRVPVSNDPASKDFYADKALYVAVD